MYAMVSSFISLSDELWLIQYSLVSPGFLAFKSWSGVYTAAAAAQLGTLRTRLIAHLSLSFFLVAIFIVMGSNRPHNHRAYLRG